MGRFYPQGLYASFTLLLLSGRLLGDVSEASTNTPRSPPTIPEILLSASWLVQFGMVSLQKIVGAARELKSHKRGMWDGAMGIFIALVSLGLVAIIGIFVFAKVSVAIPTDGMTAAQNASVENVKSTFLSAMDLGIIGLIVLAAVFILGIVMSLSGRRD